MCILSKDIERMCSEPFMPYAVRFLPPGNIMLQPPLRKEGSIQWGVSLVKLSAYGNSKSCVDLMLSYFVIFALICKLFIIGNANFAIPGTVQFFQVVVIWPFALRSKLL